MSKLNVGKNRSNIQPIFMKFKLNCIISKVQFILKQITKWPQVVTLLARQLCYCIYSYYSCY